MNPTLLAAAEDAREASPIALVVILALLVAVVLLIRSMNTHLRRMRANFEAKETPTDSENERQS